MKQTFGEVVYYQELSLCVVLGRSMDEDDSAGKCSSLMADTRCCMNFDPCLDESLLQSAYRVSWFTHQLLTTVLLNQ